MTVYNNPYQMLPVFPGMKIGLLGGSFNPPHEGHVQISITALHRLQLDQLWWCVSPGNPLKNHEDLCPLEERLYRCQKIVTHPAIRVVACETAFNVNHTVDLVRILIRQERLVRFVWIMGADNLGTLHHWKRWRKLVKLVPMAIIDRPGLATSPYASTAGHALKKFRLNERDSSLLAEITPPVWTFIHAQQSFLSSTLIRDKKIISGCQNNSRDYHENNK